MTVARMIKLQTVVSWVCRQVFLQVLFPKRELVLDVQINGCEVQDREKAVAMLSNEEARSIVLLVTRPEIQVNTHPQLHGLPALS